MSKDENSSDYKEEIKELDEIDLSKVSIQDIKNMKNKVLRDSILRLITRPSDDILSHQNHESHSDHTTMPHDPVTPEK